MFSLKVTEDEISEVRAILSAAIYPHHVTLIEITRIVYGLVTDIRKRQIRLAIQELRKRGYPIIAKRGYSMMGDDPEPATHFVNGLYSRAHKLTQEADIMYGLIKQKYGNEVSKKVCQLPGQSTLWNYATPQLNNEPPFHKSYTREGIENQFQADQ